MFFYGTDVIILVHNILYNKYLFEIRFRLADIKPGEIVCDPMCGGGSIPIEGALAFQNGFFIGGDNHNLAAERTANNLKVFDRKLQADSLQWDVTNIPLKGWFKFFLMKPKALFILTGLIICKPDK